MLRLSPIAGIAIVTLGITGCATDWDTLTSHRFRDGLLEHPWTTSKQAFVPEDPMLVLRTEPPRDGDERAAAMHRLVEPLRNRGTQEDQDIMVNILATAAVSDASPVLRMEAVTALSRFEDPRVVGILITAYQNAHGRSDLDPEPLRLPKLEPITKAGASSAGRAPTKSKPGLGADFDPTRQPTGFQPEWVNIIRCRIVEAIGRTNRPEAAKFLATVAGAAGKDIGPDGSEVRDIKLAAIRGLGQCRQAESVIALTQVLNQETSVKPVLQDTAAINRATEGLVRLTGKKLPPDSQQWNEVVQAGVVIAPEPPWWEDAVVQVSAWLK